MSKLILIIISFSFCAISIFLSFEIFDQHEILEQYSENKRIDKILYNELLTSYY